jgi:anti-sigma B factor antagonist
MLSTSTVAGASGPVVVLAGEADLTSAEELSAPIDDQLASGTRYLTIDASALTFADSMTVRILVMAAKTLAGRGGGLVLLRPQPAVARILQLTGVDQVMTIRWE